MASYGAIPTSENEEVPLNEQEEESSFSRCRREIGEVLESKPTHMAIVGLTLIDIALVMCQIAASLLGFDDTEEAQWILELFTHASLAIVSIFLFEISLKVFAFGLGYFWGGSKGLLHLADAVIIIVSFFLEVFLTGAEQELGALLIVFRLWRVLKLTGAVAIETAEYGQARAKALEARVMQLEEELEEAQQENERLRAHTTENV
ncbi:hypothetical protein BG011_003022 [Mortierella polycephala]|uniref:Voltage-gated hydrogen channel 1 n=1 Tax=Mortierella polycephala TaxID=41804 RepID=A0A9P6PKA4_9FUNG|nr:hypothetical protein BG011_003022 [Mortierella polycephala]